VWVVPADGSGDPRQITGEGSFAHISPDGRHVAYRYQGEIYVAAIDDPVNTQQQVSTAGGVRPRWSIDGRVIYYARWVEGFFGSPTDMMAATLEVGERVRVVRNTRLFDASGYIEPVAFQVDPLGRGFVMLKPDLSPRPPNVLVLHFIEELKEKVGT
jgi:hypothetical protein